MSMDTSLSRKTWLVARLAKSQYVLSSHVSLSSNFLCFVSKCFRQSHLRRSCCVMQLQIEKISPPPRAPY